MEDDMKINIGFQIDEGMLVFGFDFFPFCLVMLVLGMNVLDKNL
jgi:hypothetical protein